MKGHLGHRVKVTSDQLLCHLKVPDPINMHYKSKIKINVAIKVKARLHYAYRHKQTDG